MLPIVLFKWCCSSGAVQEELACLLLCIVQGSWHACQYVLCERDQHACHYVLFKRDWHAAISVLLNKLAFMYIKTS